MSTRDDIRTAATQHGWELISSTGWDDEYQRDITVASESKLGRLFAHTGHQARERVYVTFSGELDRLRLHTASYSDPGSQSALTGDFVGTTEVFAGRNKFAQVLARLARVVQCPTDVL